MFDLTAEEMEEEGWAWVNAVEREELEAKMKDWDLSAEEMEDEDRERALEEDMEMEMEMCQDDDFLAAQKKERLRAQREAEEERRKGFQNRLKERMLQNPLIEEVDLEPFNQEESVVSNLKKSIWFQCVTFQPRGECDDRRGTARLGRWQARVE